MVRPVASSGLSDSAWPRARHAAQHSRQILNQSPPPSYRNTVRDTTSLDIPLRIERKLARYNASHSVCRRWLFEILSVVVSALCMGGIVAILIVLKNQPLRKWPLGLTLSTILSKIASAALILPISEAIGQLKWSWFHGKTSRNALDFEIFDKASRGAWGSFLLLFRTRGRSLAALGAVLTLLLLAIDTFFQQVTDLPTGWTLYGEGLIPRVVQYESDNPREFQNGVEMATSDQRIQAISDSFLIANGTTQSVFGNGHRPEIPVSCPTSNCTWAPTDTLGFCGKCVEATELLTYSCLDTVVDWTSNLNATISSYPNTTVCGYFLNATTSSPILMSGYIRGSDGTPVGESLMMRTLPLLTNPLRTPLWGGSVHFKEVPNPVIDVLISSIATISQFHAHAPPMLQECVMEWCVKTIESNYWEGTYHENVTNYYI